MPVYAYFINSIQEAHCKIKGVCKSECTHFIVYLILGLKNKTSLDVTVTTYYLSFITKQYFLGNYER